MGWVSGIDTAAATVAAIVLPLIQDETDANSVLQSSAIRNLPTDIYPLNLVAVVRVADDSTVVDDQINSIFLPLISRGR